MKKRPKEVRIEYEPTIAVVLTLLAGGESIVGAWHPLDKGEEAAQLYCRPTGWSRAYRFIAVRRVKCHRRHANVENGIKELKSDLIRISVCTGMTIHKNTHNTTVN